VFPIDSVGLVSMLLILGKFPIAFLGCFVVGFVILWLLLFVLVLVAFPILGHSYGCYCYQLLLYPMAIPSIGLSHGLVSSFTISTFDLSQIQVVLLCLLPSLMFHKIFPGTSTWILYEMDSS
jgi:hypothetical protein